MATTYPKELYSGKRDTYTEREKEDSRVLSVINKRVSKEQKAGLEKKGFKEYPSSPWETKGRQTAEYWLREHDYHDMTFNYLTSWVNEDTKTALTLNDPAASPATDVDAFVVWDWNYETFSPGDWSLAPNQTEYNDFNDAKKDLEKRHAKAKRENKKIELESAKSSARAKASYEKFVGVKLF